MKRVANNIWLIIFVGSLTALCFIVFKIRLRWFKVTFINIALAAVVLFALSQVEMFGSYALPINILTIGTVGLLGLPGIAMLFGLKMILL